MIDQWQKARELAAQGVLDEVGLWSQHFASTLEAASPLQRECILGAVDAALSAFAEAGYVLVPREPSEKMLKEGASYSWANSADYSEEASEDNALDIYKVMITAALKDRT